MFLSGIAPVYLIRTRDSKQEEGSTINGQSISEALVCALTQGFRKKKVVEEGTVKVLLHRKWFALFFDLEQLF